jgi:hypothetical protein
VPIAFTSSTTARHRFVAPPVVGLALLLALGLTGCSGGDADVAAVPKARKSASSPAPVIAGPTLTTPAPEMTTPLPTVPPGDPGDGPSVPEDTSGVEEPAGAALTNVPKGALLDATTAGQVLGDPWTSSAAPADSCAAPRPTGAVATRSTSLGGSGGTVIENVATYNGTGGVASVSALAKRLRGCGGWTEEAEPPLGEDSAEFSRTSSTGVQRVVVVTSEGVTVTVVGRGGVASNTDNWSAIVDVAVGTSCVAAPDGCH